MKTAVLGCGSWGTALAVLLGNKGYEVTLWGRPEDGIFDVQRDRINARYLPDAPLPASVIATESLDAAMNGAEAVVVVIPSAGVREVAAALRGRLSLDQVLIHAGKGLESETGLRGSEVITQELGEDIGHGCVALSGPNLAVELSRNVPTATVVASLDMDRAARAQELFAAPSLRVYRNPDIVGVELGGALKNVLAIGAGIADGLGYGDNTKATLVTRGLIEMMRLGETMGANPKTFSGLSGFGDLMVTCASHLSRNLRLGRMLGEGSDLESSLAQLGQVAEGMPTCQAAYLLSRKHDIYMPITEQIHAVLFEGRSPKQAVHELMNRVQKDELS